MRRGFTMVEMLVVISIMVLLTTMTIGAINLSLTGRTAMSGAANGVKSKLQGSVNRAAYASAGDEFAVPRGVRLIPDTDEPSVVRSLVYVGAFARPEQHVEDRDDLNHNGKRDELHRYIQIVDPAVASAFDLQRRWAIIGVNTNWTALASRGLIGPNSLITIDIGDAGQFACTIHPDSFPIRRETRVFSDYDPDGDGTPNQLIVNSVNPFEQIPDTDPAMYGHPTNDEVLFLIPLCGIDPFARGCLTEKDSRSIHPFDTPPRKFRFTSLAGASYSGSEVLAAEEISTLPTNIVIDLEASEIGDSRDILFLPDGRLLDRTEEVRLHLRPFADALEDLEPQHGDYFLTIKPQSGQIALEEQ